MRVGRWGWGEGSGEKGVWRLVGGSMGVGRWGGGGVDGSA